MHFKVWHSHGLSWFVSKGEIKFRKYLGKNEEQLPQKTVGRLLADSRTTVVYRLLRKSSAGSRLTVGRLSADCWSPVGNLLAKCRLRTLVEYQKSLSSQGRTLHIDAKWNFLAWVRHIVLVFLGTNLLAIPSHHPRSQEAKNLFTAASCSSFRNHQIKQKSMTSFYCLSY